MALDTVHRLSDDDLVTDAQSGDALALDQLIGAVHRAVVSYSRARLASYAGGLDTAEDVAQETCVAVIRVLPKYRPQGSPFAAFVYAIAANKVADVQRRFSRSAVLVDVLPDQREPSPNPEEQVIAADDVRAANELLSLLPQRMRTVLVLRASGLSAEVIGQQLDMTANAVRVAQHRASAKIRRLAADSEQHRQILELMRQTVA